MIKSRIRNLTVLSILGFAAAACTTTEARLSGAAAGAGAGALIAGPIGAVAGGAVGVIAAPSIARSRS